MLRPTVGNCCADLDSWIDAVERHDKKGTWSNLYMLHSSSNAFMSKCTVFNGKTWGSLNHLKSAWRPKFPRLAASCLDQRIAMDVSDKTNPCRSYKDLAGDLASFMSSMPFMIPICCCNFSADTRKFAFLSTSLTLWEHLAAHPPWYLSVQREEACSCAVTFALSHDCQLHWLQKQPAPLLSLHFMAFCVCACLSALSLRPLIATSWSQQRWFSKDNMPPDANVDDADDADDSDDSDDDNAGRWCWCCYWWC